MTPPLTPAVPWSVGLMWLALTVGVYVASKLAYQRLPRVWLSPIVVTPTTLVLLLLATHTPYASYWSQTRWLSWLLGPATVAFALPIHQQRALLRRYPVTLALGVLTGVVMGLVSSWLMGRWVGLPHDTLLSVLPRSVSSPFAIEAATMLGGHADLAVLCVMLTGIFGMLAGQGWLAFIGVRHRVAVGSAFGAATHGVGTAKAWQIGQEQGAIASLTMIFSGVILVLATPWLARLLG